MTDPNVNPLGEDPNDTHSSLLERLKADDAAGWERFVEIYAPLIIDWCKASGLQEADAQDVGQEVFKAVNGAIGDFRADQPGGYFRGWLRTITNRKVCDFVRKRESHPQAHGGSTATQLFMKVPSGEGEAGGSDISSNPNSGRAAEAREKQMVLERAIEVILKRCEKKTRLAFTRVVLEGKSVEEVAVELEMTPNAVYLMKYRLLQRLRTELNGLVEFEE